MPWCPKCKSEYVEGIKVCADCGTALVESLDAVKEPDKEEQENMRVYMQHMQEMKELQEKEAKSASGKETSGKNVRTATVTAPNRELSEEEEEALMEARQRSLMAMGHGKKGGSKGVYEDTAKRAEEYKSGAYTLMVVGILGLVALAVLSTDLLPVRLYFSSQWIVYLVMGAMFILFFIGGVLSLRSGKDLEKKAVKEKDEKEEVVTFLKERIRTDVIDEKVLDPNGEETTETRYFKRTSVLRVVIKQYFPDMDDVYMEHIIDEMYTELFGDED